MDPETRTQGRESLIRWPRQILGPPPGLLEINLVCWGFFIGYVVVPLLAPAWVAFRKGGDWSDLLPCDFIYFYSVGRIAHEYPLSRLYEYSLLLKTTDEIFPLKGYIWGPSPYPPFVALFFSLFARISFLSAYLLWMATSLVLYTVGIAVTVKGIFLKQPLKTSLVFCFALGFYPFFICTLKNGQLSALAFFSVAMAIALERDSKPFASGLVLSILAYKPTLLLLIFPMLILTRRFRAFWGFIAGGAALLLITTSIAGFDIWRIYYLHSLGFVGQFIESQGQYTLQLWEYVDFHSFSYAVPGGRSVVALALLSGLSIVIALALAASLWRSARATPPVQDLAWAATITWTLLLNLYVPVWDSTLCVIAILLTLRAFRDLDQARLVGWIVFLALLIFAVSWNLVAKSNRHGSQMMMFLLFVLGWVQLYWLYRTTRPRSSYGKDARVEHAIGSA